MCGCKNLRARAIEDVFPALQRSETVPGHRGCFSYPWGVCLQPDRSIKAALGPARAAFRHPTTTGSAVPSASPCLKNDARPSAVVAIMSYGPGRVIAGLLVRRTCIWRSQFEVVSVHGVPHGARALRPSTPIDEGEIDARLTSDVTHEMTRAALCELEQPFRA